MNRETILRQLAIAEAAGTASVDRVNYSYDPDHYGHLLDVRERARSERAKLELTIYVDNFPHEEAPSPEETLLAAARAILHHGNVLTDDELFERMALWFGSRVRGYRP